MHDAFRKYSPTLGTPAAPLGGQSSVGSYLGGKLFEAAVKAADTDDITAASVKKGLYALKGETLGGMSQPLTFVEGKTNLFNCAYTYKIQDKKFVMLNDGKQICGPAALMQSIATKFAK
jgi:branched-chain amino acid transport system substrate-binding protein